jgi:hypothetical protein
MGAFGTHMTAAFVAFQRHGQNSGRRNWKEIRSVTAGTKLRSGMLGGELLPFGNVPCGPEDLKL